MNIYIVYDSHYEDSDIISVPDRMEQQIENIGQLFNNWLSQPNIPNDYYVYIDGKKYVNCETKGFVDWLNAHFLCEDERAFIVKQHVEYRNGALKIDF